MGSPLIMAVCSEVHGWQAWYQELGWAWNLSGWRDGTASSTLALGQKDPLQRPQLGPQKAGLVLVAWQVWLPPGPWEGCCLVSGWVPGWAGLALDCG